MSFPPPPPPPHSYPRSSRQQQQTRSQFPPPPPPPPPPAPSSAGGRISNSNANLSNSYYGHQGSQSFQRMGNAPALQPKGLQNRNPLPPPPPPPGQSSHQQRQPYSMRPPPPPGPPSMSHQSFQTRPFPNGPPPLTNMQIPKPPYGLSTPLRPPPPNNSTTSSYIDSQAQTVRPSLPPMPNQQLQNNHSYHQARPQDQYNPQQQSHSNGPQLYKNFRPPLFTRSKNGSDETSTDAPLPTYFPKGCWSNNDPRLNEPAPPADSRFISLDDGAATPDFIRPTMYRLPSDRQVLRQATGMGEDSSNHRVDCLGVLCTPMALPSSDHPSPPLGPLLGIHDRPRDPQNESDRRLTIPASVGRVPVDYTTNRKAPPRCGNCNAYVNPFWSMSKCNFCHRSSGRSSKGGTQSQYGEKMGTVDYPVEGPYVTRTNGPVRPHWLFCVDLTCPKILDYVDFVLDEIWPAFYKDIVMPHMETTQGQHGKKVAQPSVAMVFVCSSGIYIPQKGNGELSKDGFLVMPNVVYDEAFSPLPLSEWSWSIPDEYDDLLDLWKSRIRPDLLPRLINEKIKQPVNSNSSSQAERKGGFSMSAGGAALQFLIDALEDTGGRGVFWTWRRPNFGLGALVDRERLLGGNQRNKGSPGISLYMPLQEAKKQQPENLVDPNLKDAAEFYTTLGERCVKAKVAIDIIMHTDPDVPQSFLDLATLGRLCEQSSGRLVWIGKPSFHGNTWRRAIQEEVMRPLYLTACDAIFKIRCSQGLQVRAMLSSVGNLLTSSSLGGQEDEVELSVVTPETCIAVTLEHRVGGLPSPKDRQFAYVQTALLYTNPWTGDRRVRVSTLAIRIATSPEAIVDSMDFGALAALQLRLNFPNSNYSSAAARISFGNNSNNPTSPDQKGDSLLNDAKFGLYTAMRRVLVANRRLNGGFRKDPVPESLKSWPLFVMSACKSPLLRPSIPARGTGIRSMTPSPGGDERFYYMYHARKTSPACAMLLVHPVVLDLNAASYEWKKVGSTFADDLANLKNSPVLDLPSMTPASVSNLACDGIYLLDTCFATYVLIEEDAPEQFTEDLQKRVYNANQQLQLWSQVGRDPKCLRPGASLPIIVVRKKSDVAQYQSILRWMVLDATSHDKDFQTFFTKLHQQIQNEA